MALARMGGCWKTVVREAVWGPWVELGAGSCASAGSLLGGCSREASGREQLCETAGKLLGGRLLGGRLLGDCGEASFYYLMPQPAQFFGRLMCVAAQCMLLCAHCIAHRGFAYSKLLSVCGRCCSELTFVLFLGALRFAMLLSVHDNIVTRRWVAVGGHCLLADCSVFLQAGSYEGNTHNNVIHT